MSMNRNNFQEILTPVHQFLSYEAYDELPEQYTQVFDQAPMRMATETFQKEGGYGLWDSNDEGDTINEDSMSEGPTITFTAGRKDKGYEVTWELVQDDLYGVFGGMGKKGSAQNLAQGARATIETDTAAILSNGFANTGYDGVPLFSNSHTLIDSALTDDNLITGALTDTTLKNGLIQLRKTRNEAGIKVMAIPGQVIVPPDLEFTANTLIYSAGTPGNDYNDANTVPGLRITIMDYLTSTTAWFLRAKNFKNLVHRFREEPWFDSQNIQRKVDFFCFGYYRSTQGYFDHRGIVGSLGT